MIVGVLLFPLTIHVRKVKTLLLITLVSVILVTGCDKTVDVKYVDEPVDLSNFEYLDTSESSFVNGAWYDSWDDEMVIMLEGTYYQYCYLPEEVWKDFKSASSFGSFYNSSIKGSYDCSENSELKQRMDTRWDECWSEVEWDDVVEIMRSEGWGELVNSSDGKSSGLWESPGGDIVPSEALEDYASEAWDKAYDSCMYGAE